MPKYTITAFDSEDQPVKVQHSMATIYDSVPTKSPKWTKLGSIMYEYPSVAYWRLQTSSGKTLISKANPYYKD